MVEEKYTPSRNYCGMKQEVVDLLCRLRTILYPNIFGPKESRHISEALRKKEARVAFERVLGYFVEKENFRSEIVTTIFEKMPEIEKSLLTDIEAAYKGDPAAGSYDEIVLSYPSFECVSIHRIAHELYKMKVPILPRVMSEHAHSITGIDIHPGAEIGDYFFIDHGTGVVIGETATIGTHVKLYQGVTIGAKSFEVDEDGTLVKGIKRHPDIGDNVVVYAGATILGGDTQIGDNCIIGGNVWLTESVPANNTVYAQHPEISQREIK